MRDERRCSMRLKADVLTGAIVECPLARSVATR
jgi:hypothetical protein